METTKLFSEQKNKKNFTILCGLVSFLPTAP